MTNTGRLQALGEVEGVGGKRERLAGPVGDQEDMLGVAVRGVGADEEIRLLGAGRHAGRGPAALHVEHDHRNLGEIGEAEELLHQRDARAGGGGEGARAVPAGADDHADRRDLVLGLEDGVVLLPGRVDAEAGAVPLERLGDRGRRGDRIPGAHRRAAIDRPERRGEIAFGENAVADRLAAPDANAERAGEARPSPRRGRCAKRAGWLRSACPCP